MGGSIEGQRKGGQGSRGYPFAHGKVDPRETGRLGGRPKGPHSETCKCITCNYKRRRADWERL